MIEGLQANNKCSPGNCEIGDNQLYYTDKLGLWELSTLHITKVKCTLARYNRAK